MDNDKKLLEVLKISLENGWWVKIQEVAEILQHRARFERLSRKILTTDKQQEHTVENPVDNP